MFNNRYKIYLDQTMQLAQNIVIKLDDVAVAMNYAVMLEHGGGSVDLTDKSSWKYYQNISGQYHITDKVIRINSLDIPSEIDFTVENLMINKATRIAYEPGSRYHRELITMYPNMELLITGVLYPTNKQTAIDTIDGTILNYPRYLIDDNEYTFITELQTWISNYLFRWVNKQFSISDDLYVHSYVYQLYSHLVQAILSIRLQKCRTNEAHSYHIEQYLASHGFLDTYLETLTKKQALFFYRNICYIERNAGKKDTFDWLTEKIMTDRDLPFYDFIINHNTKGINSTSATVPEITIKRKAINVSAEQSKKNNYTLEDALVKLNPLTVHNTEYHADEVVSIAQDLTYSDSSVTTTKVLQSSVIDRSGSAPYTLNNLTYNHWLYLVAKKKYLSLLFIKLPNFSESVRFTAQEAVALYLYASHKALTTTVLERVPRYRVNRVVRLDSPTYLDFKNMVGVEANNILINKIIDTRVLIEPIISIVDFKTKCTEIYIKAQEQFIIQSLTDNSYERGYAQALVDYLYCDETVMLDELLDGQLGIKYTNFLISKGLDLDNYTQADYLQLATNILGTATHNDVYAAQSVASIQKSMISLFMQLSSYSIQISPEINNSAIVVATSSSVRFGDIKMIGRADDYITSAPTRVKAIKIKSKDKALIDFNMFTHTHVNSVRSSNSFYKLGVSLKYIKDKNNQSLGKQYIGLKHNYVGSNTFDILSKEQKIEIANNCQHLFT